MKLPTPATLVALALLGGCGRPAPAPAPVPAGPPPSSAATRPSSPVGEFRRPDDPAFTAAQRALVAAARKRLATSDHRADDAYARVRPAGDGGHEVFLLFVTGYPDGQPEFRPCHHAAVLFDGDGTVTKVLRGPECWP